MQTCNFITHINKYMKEIQKPHFLLNLAHRRILLRKCGCSPLHYELLTFFFEPRDQSLTYIHLSCFFLQLESLNFFSNSSSQIPEKEKLFNFIIRLATFLNRCQTNPSCSFFQPFPKKKVGEYLVVASWVIHNHLVLHPYGCWLNLHLLFEKQTSLPSRQSIWYFELFNLFYKLKSIKKSCVYYELLDGADNVL